MHHPLKHIFTFICTFLFIFIQNNVFPVQQGMDIYIYISIHLSTQSILMSQTCRSSILSSTHSITEQSIHCKRSLFTNVKNHHFDTHNQKCTIYTTICETQPEPPPQAINRFKSSFSQKTNQPRSNFNLLSVYPCTKPVISSCKNTHLHIS